jgi:hypothetical protein
MNDDKHDKKLSATVKYVGHSDFQETFPSSTEVRHVKAQALKTFGIEESAASQYALQYDKSDVADQTRLESFGQQTLIFTLVLINEVPKGR